MNDLTRRAATLLAVLALGGLAHGFAADTPGRGPLSAAAGPKAPFEGLVTDTLPAGSYTYFQVERADRAREWVVTLASSAGAREARTGSRLRVIPVAYSERFESKRLERAFDRLHFAVVRPL